jgi:histidinol dehydrogenase
MNVTNLNIRRIDGRREDIRAAMAELRAKLSPQGNVVSEAGRRRTIEVFGEPLSPQQVVERICRDVQERGMAAVLDYSARIDKATLTADAIRVPAAELAKAHSGADPRLLEAIRRVAQNIREFHRPLRTCGWSGQTARFNVIGR